MNEYTERRRVTKQRLTEFFVCKCDFLFFFSKWKHVIQKTKQKTTPVVDSEHSNIALTRILSAAFRIKGDYSERFFSPACLLDIYLFSFGKWISFHSHQGVRPSNI